MAKKTKGQEPPECPEDLVGMYKLLESIRSRAGRDQFDFLNLSATNIQSLIRTAFVLNTGAIVALYAFINTEFAEKFLDYETNFPLFFIIIPSFVFVLGIMLAVRSSHFHYLNYMYCVDVIRYGWEAEKKYIEDCIKEKYSKFEYKSSLLPEILIYVGSIKFHILFRFLQFHRIFGFHKIYKITEKYKAIEKCADSPDAKLKAKSKALSSLISTTDREGVKSVYYSYAFFAIGCIVATVILLISILFPEFSISITFTK